MRRCSDILVSHERIALFLTAKHSDHCGINMAVQTALPLYYALDLFSLVPNVVLCKAREVWGLDCGALHTAAGPSHLVLRGFIWNVSFFLRVKYIVIC